MLFREVRGGFFQERVFRLKLAVTAFQLAYALLVRHVGRDGLAGGLLPVGLHPESERGIVNADFSRNLRYGQRVINDSLSGLLLELRSKSSASWHCVPFLSRRILLDPLSGNGGAPQGHHLLDRGRPCGGSCSPPPGRGSSAAPRRARQTQPGWSR